jgi:hypothetical protein
MYYANQILQEVVAGQTLRANVGAAAALPLYGLVVLGAATLTLREHS